MDNGVDYYDVQKMICDEGYVTDKKIYSELEAAKSELRREIEDLREELASLNRVLQSRTEHLV